MPPAKSSRAAVAAVSRVKKSSENSTIVALKLPSPALARFPHDKSRNKSGWKPSPSLSSISTPDASAKQSPAPADDGRAESANNDGAADDNDNDNHNSNNSSGANGSPTDAHAADSSSTTTLQVPVDHRKKGNGGAGSSNGSNGGARAGTKRASSALAESQPKARAKPGPKRRKLDGANGPEDPSRPWTTPAAPTTGHKLGPKANQGAINAGLRALDRSGKPCRKWAKNSFTVKSFTGIMWALPTWSAPKRQSEGGESSTNTPPTSNTEDGHQASGGGGGGDRDHRAGSSSNVGSETNGAEAKHLVSSPAAAATPA